MFKPFPPIAPIFFADKRRWSYAALRCAIFASAAGRCPRYVAQMWHQTSLSCSATIPLIANRRLQSSNFAALLYVALLTLAVAANIGAAAVLLWTVCAVSVAYRKARA